MIFIAVLMCGPIRTSPGGRVEKIVVVGGLGGWPVSSYLNTVEVYDITTNSWQTGAFNFYHIADIKGECGDAQSTIE